MYFAIFRTESPLDMLVRALAELDRAGFALTGVHLAPGTAPAEVRIDYAAGGTVAPETWLARLERMPGILAVTGGPCPGLEG
ncbi:hypothetical protein [Gemmobacter sp.]|uniref:hypothetical protein n=1 Tax=Gemmobacter sp. TaxID=1898957 RepID=UPI002AFE9016|nr:hypothetical protein [Gemmobacter sp.]